MIKLENIIKNYYIENNKIEVLKDLSLTLEQGEIVTLTGKSGAGKSTLLNIIASLERPDSGVIQICGEELSRMNDKKLSKFRNKNIGIVFQFHHLLPEFTALENVAMPLLISGKKSGSYKLAAEMLDRVQLSDRMRHKPAELSGGEQQRVAIARALVCSPKLLLMDEPTGNLDEDTAEKILDMALNIAKSNNMTTLFITHNSRFVKKTDKTFTLVKGKICQD